MTAAGKVKNNTPPLLGIVVLIDKDDDSGSVFKLYTSFASGDNYFTVGGVDFLQLSTLQNLTTDEIRTVITNINPLCSPNQLVQQNAIQ